MAKLWRVLRIIFNLLAIAGFAMTGFDVVRLMWDAQPLSAIIACAALASTAVGLGLDTIKLAFPGVDFDA